MSVANLNPAPGAVDCQGSALTLTFSERPYRPTAPGRVARIVYLTDQAQPVVVDATDSSVIHQGPGGGFDVVINLGSGLESAARVEVRLDPGFVVDSAGNDWAGLGPGDWIFDTGGRSQLRLESVSPLPLSNLPSGTASLVLNFNQNWRLGGSPVMTLTDRVSVSVH